MARLAVVVTALMALAFATILWRGTWPLEPQFDAAPGVEVHSGR